MISTSITGALFSNTGVRKYDSVVIGFSEYVTLQEYLSYEHFVATGGTLIFLNACNFLAQVKSLSLRQQGRSSFWTRLELQRDKCLGGTIQQVELEQFQLDRQRLQAGPRGRLLNRRWFDRQRLKSDSGRDAECVRVFSLSDWLLRTRRKRPDKFYRQRSRVLGCR